MTHTREAEIYDNFRYFQGVVSSLMPSFGGQYALMRSMSIVDYFRTAGEAVMEGVARFGEQPFSIQHVNDRPIDLGFLSHATDNGNSFQR